MNDKKEAEFPALSSHVVFEHRKSCCITYILEEQQGHDIVTCPLIASEEIPKSDTNEKGECLLRKSSP
jgi:hypothetical protein